MLHSFRSEGLNIVENHIARLTKRFWRAFIACLLKGTLNKKGDHAAAFWDAVAAKR